MAAIDWPSTLPGPRPDGSSEMPGDPKVRSKMDAGPPKVRRRHTAAVKDWRMAFDLTKAEVAIFETFYETTTDFGTSRFNMDHPRTGVEEEFRFKGRPTFVNLGGDAWEATCEMEQLP